MLTVQAVLEEREYAENFPVALRLLPGEVREHLHAVYAVVRTIDDVGDEAEGDRIRQLLQWRSDLAATWAGRPPDDPVLIRLRRSIELCDLPQQPFQDLVEANLVDQTTVRYDTFTDLIGYCRLSAVPIGRIVLAVFGQGGRRAEQLSDDVCIGLQLVEHWQDVGEDRRRGRVYLPAEDLDRFDVSLDELDRPAASAPLRRLMMFEVERAAELMERGAGVVGLVSGWAQVAIGGYLAGGRATVAALRRSEGEVLARHVRPRRRDTAALLVRILLDARREGER